MSGKQAVQQVIAMAAREEFIAAELVARALSLSSRQVLRDWRRRRYPEVKIGRTVLLQSSLVMAAYFSPSSQTT